MIPVLAAALTVGPVLAIVCAVYPPKTIHEFGLRLALVLAMANFIVSLP